MPTLEELIQQQLSDTPPAPVLPALPRQSADDGGGGGWTGLLGDVGEVLSGGQSPTYRLRGSERAAAGSRALLNFGINMLMASGPQRVRPDLGSIFASGLQGAQQSMDLDQRRAAAVAQADYTQRMELAKLGVEQGRDRTERIKNALTLLQLQNRPIINPDGSVTTGGATTSPGASTYAGFVSGLEGSGKDPRSSAIGGIIDSTWQSFVSAHPNLFTGMTPEQAMAARNNPALVAQANDWYAQQNAPVLSAAGITPSGQTLGIAHRLGPGAATKVLQAPDNDLVTKYLSEDAVRANPALAGVTVGQLKRTYAGAPNPSFLSATPAPPGAVRTQVAAVTPNRATDATPAPPAPAQTPPAATVAGATPAPAPAPTTGPLAGLPKMDDFVQQNLAQPSPEERALWHTPLPPEEEKILRDGMKRLQSSVDAARASFNAVGSKDSESAYQAAQKAYSDAEAELAKRQRESNKVGDDRQAEYWKGERERLKGIYGELVKSNAQLMNTKESSDQQLAREQIGKINESATGARRNIAQVEQIQALSDLIGPGNEGILSTQIAGRPIAAFLQQYNIGTDQLKTKAGAVLAFKSLTDRFITDMRAGQGLGPQSDRDLTQAQGWVVNAGMDGATRNAMLALMRDTYLRQIRYSSLVQKYHAGGDKLGEAEDKADKELGPSVPRMDRDITADSPRWGQWLVEHNVQPNTFYRDPDGRMRIYKGGQ